MYIICPRTQGSFRVYVLLNEYDCQRKRLQPKYNITTVSHRYLFSYLLPMMKTYRLSFLPVFNKILHVLKARIYACTYVLFVYHGRTLFKLGLVIYSFFFFFFFFVLIPSDCNDIGLLKNVNFLK